MPDHRGSRFALEVLFLVALAIGLTLAELDPLEIGGIMLLGWLIVAALEWAAWRDEPHYGSGLPPRYYVPTVNLPPARPLEQVPAGYPEAQRDEAPTWIASAALRAEMLGEWPHSAPVESEAAKKAEDPPPIEPPVPLPPLAEAEPLPDAAADPLAAGAALLLDVVSVDFDPQAANVTAATATRTRADRIERRCTGHLRRICSPDVRNPAVPTTPTRGEPIPRMAQSAATACARNQNATPGSHAAPR